MPSSRRRRPTGPSSIVIAVLVALIGSLPVSAAPTPAPELGVPTAVGTSSVVELLAAAERQVAGLPTQVLTTISSTDPVLEGEPEPVPVVDAIDTAFDGDRYAGTMTRDAVEVGEAAVEGGVQYVRRAGGPWGSTLFIGSLIDAGTYPTSDVLDPELATLSLAPIVPASPFAGAWAAIEELSTFTLTRDDCSGRICAYVLGEPAAGTGGTTAWAELTFDEVSGQLISWSASSSVDGATVETAADVLYGVDVPDPSVELDPGIPAAMLPDAVTWDGSQVAYGVEAGHRLLDEAMARAWREDVVIRDVTSEYVGPDTEPSVTDLKLRRDAESGDTAVTRTVGETTTEARLLGGVLYEKDAAGDWHKIKKATELPDEYQVDPVELIASFAAMDWTGIRRTEDCDPGACLELVGLSGSSRSTALIDEATGRLLSIADRGTPMFTETRSRRDITVSAPAEPVSIRVPELAPKPTPTPKPTPVPPEYLLVDTETSPGARCLYEGAAGTQYFTGMRMKAPTIYYPGKPGVYGSVGWRVLIESDADGDGEDWVLVKKSTLYSANATVDTPAPMPSAVTVDWAGPNEGDYRAVARIIWYTKDATVLDQVDQVIQHHRRSFDDRIVDVCDGSVPTGG